MTSKISLFAALMTVAVLFTSCLDTDNSSTTYDDVAISSFSLGTMKCYRHVTTSAGKDSTYSYTYTGSTFPFYIDQLNNTIYNVDSLVYGTDVEHVIATVAAKNSGTVIIKSLDDESQYSYYSSSDSIDFSQPRKFVVISNDGAHSREYTVNVNVHTEYADSFSWDNVATDANIAAFKQMKAVQLDSKLYLLGNDGTTATLLSSANGTSWETVSLSNINSTLSTDASIAVSVDKLYLLNAGTLYSTTDGSTWATVTQNSDLAVIAGGLKDEGYNELYAVKADGSILVSTDEGVTWSADEMESTQYVDNSAYLPVRNINFVSTKLKTNSEVGRAVILGNMAQETETDTLSVVWNKIVDAGEPQSWYYLPNSWDNHYYIMPAMESLSATYYADGIVAIGGAGVNTNTEAFSKLYYSPDWGVTWHQQSGMSLPSDFSADNTTAAAVVADGKGYIYLIAAGSGTVWRGRKNSETWATSNKYYN